MRKKNDIEKNLPLIPEEQFFATKFEIDEDFKWHESWPEDMTERLVKWFNTPILKRDDKGTD